MDVAELRARAGSAGAGPTPAARIAAWVRELPARHGAATLAALAAVVVLALGLRVGRALDPVAVPGPDSDAYGAIASHLYATGEYGTPGMENETDWSPGAVLFYTAVYVATGGVREEAARLAVALIGAMLVVAAYALARRLARAASLPEAPAGIAAALGVAVYPAFVYDAGRLMSEPFAELGLAGFVLSYLWASEPERGGWSYAIPGALLGLTALFRPEYLPFSVVFAALAALWAWRRSRARDAGGGAAGDRAGGGGATERARGARTGALLPALALLAGFAVLVAPWTIRNAIALERFVPISTGGGKALFIGTYLPGDGDHYGTKRALYYEANPGSRLSADEVNLLPMQPLLDRVAARRPQLTRDAALGREGRENLERYLAERPLGLVAMAGRKVWRMWRSGSGPAMNGVAPAVLHASLALLGLGGLVLLAVRRRPEALVIGLLVLGITAVGAVLLASPRRNLILMPIVASLAGVAVSWLSAALSSSRSWSRSSS